MLSGVSIFLLLQQPLEVVREISRSINRGDGKIDQQATSSLS